MAAITWVPQSFTGSAQSEPCTDVGYKADERTTNLRVGDATILAVYTRTFDAVFVPYNGPDVPLQFEPEDYPVR